MDTARLKRFAQYARRDLIEQVTAKLHHVLDAGSRARRDNAEAVATLEGCIASEGQEAVVDRVAYTWFNRLCALRFMDVKGYNKIRVLSPLEGQSQPEILAEAKARHTDSSVIDAKVQQHVFEILDGNISTHDPQGAAYRVLVVAVCNYWSKAMPFMFQRIADYTEFSCPTIFCPKRPLLPIFVRP